MSFIFVLAHCYRCKRLFTFNPDRVPSITVRGTREPFCLECVNEVNPRRVANGLAPIVPLPGAYDPEEVDL